ncbi:MAG: hypothetical protein MJY70_06845 [Bacteroidales bacterium]|nr:hypothetical protein [Bacteroidales bacterium]
MAHRGPWQRFPAQIPQTRLRLSNEPYSHVHKTHTPCADDLQNGLEEPDFESNRFVLRHSKCPSNQYREESYEGCKRHVWQGQVCERMHCGLGRERMPDASGECLWAGSGRRDPQTSRSRRATFRH